MDLKTLGVVRPRSSQATSAFDAAVAANHRLKLHKPSVQRHVADEPYAVSTVDLPVAHRISA